jgi:hypothetical protein
MIELFLQQECGVTYNNDTVLKHHFTFATHYVPTKFGRSTLRRADYITLNDKYISTAERNHIMLLYPLSDGISVSLNDTVYVLKKNHLASFVLPQGTIIKLLSIESSDILLFECDIFETPESVTMFEIADTSYQTKINILDSDTLSDINSDQKPFFGFILSGDLILEKTKISAYDGFYITHPIQIMGNAKILTFTMPIPL